MSNIQNMKEEPDLNIYGVTWHPGENCQWIAYFRNSPNVDASTIAKNPRYNPMQKSAIAKLQTRNLGTSILPRDATSTITTHLKYSFDKN